MKLKKFTYFYPEKPQLILKESDAFGQMSFDPVYVAEPKLNEQRCELHLINGVAHFWDRHGKELTYNSNPIYEDGKNEITRILVEKFGDTGYFLFDAGLRHNKVHGVSHKLVIYDIHVYRDEVLNKLIFDERRDILEKYFIGTLKTLGSFSGTFQNHNDTVHLINQYYVNFQKVYDEYISGDLGNPDEFEGLVIKSLNGKLKLGRASGTDSIWMFKVRKATGRHRY